MDWFDDDGFWDDFSAMLFDERHLDIADSECQSIIDITHLPPKARVLDLASGVGRHSVAFARRGHRVTAVDRTAQYLEQAKERALAAGVSLELLQQDMRLFERPESFDLAVNLYTSFGFFADDADNVRVLESMRRSLASGGCAVFEMTSKEILARDWRPKHWRELEDGSVVLEERELFDNFSRVRCRWTLVPLEGPRSHYHFEHRLYAASEFEAMLLSAGFARVQIYGSLEGGPFDQEAERLVAVAWRDANTPSTAVL